ncbi:MAG: alpha/beta fold hydrolase [Desulfobacteraceae bacterium]|nr:alpha/beta fold hydrolase [Desulfobacteraceae bacterium]
MNPFLSPVSQEMEKYGRFLVEKGQPLENPVWMTPNEVVFEGFKVALRKFNRGHRGNPIVFVAPEAGHNSQIVDYGPEQSLVQCALAHFAGDVYAVDKLPAGPEHTTYTVDDSIESLRACVRAIGEPVHLVGLCQGGWQSAIFAAMFPEDVKSLTLAAAPIDFHAGDAIITQWACSLPISYYEQLVRLGNGNMPGCFIVQGFMMMNPYDRFVGDNTDLLSNIRDQVYIERYQRFAQWYYYTQPVPGTMYLKIVRSLFQENQLIKGQFEIFGQKVDLGRITQPLYLVAGLKDDITPTAQLFAAEKHVSSKKVEKEVVPAGHVGVFMGKQIIREYWSRHLAELTS